MKRVINKRPIFIAMLGLVLGIGFLSNLVLSVSKNSVLHGFMIAVFAIVFACAVFGVFFAIAFKKNNKLRRVKVFRFLETNKFSFINFIVFVMIGVLVLNVSFAKFNKLPEFENEYQVIGEIEDNYYQNNGVTFITLNNVVLTDDQGKSYKLNSRASVAIFNEGIISENSVSANNLIKFNATVSKTPLNLQGYNMNAYNDNVVYSLSLTDTNYSFETGKYDLDELIRNEYKTILKNAMQPELADISFSLLFGNDEALSDEIMQMFSVSGVVHIISVSGLHVAVMVFAISWLLKLLKFKRHYKLAIIFVVLCFYSYLCGFVPTVIRSAIMSLVFLFSLNLGERYDALNSLSISAILILLISPFNLFSLGFQLSFVSMFGLITIAPMITKSLQKIKIPNFIASSLSATLCATILTYPIIALHFSEIAIYGVLGNLIAVPLMSLAYIISFVVSTLVMLLPFMNFVLFVPELLLHVSKVILSAINQLPFAVVTMFSDGYMSTLVLLLIVYVVTFVMLSKKFKVAIVAVLLTFVVGLNYGYNLPIENVNAMSFNYTKNTSSFVLHNEHGQNILFGAGVNGYNDYKLLMNVNKLVSLDAIVVHDYSYKYHETLKQIVVNSHAKDLYIITANDDFEMFLLQEFNFVNIVVVSSPDEFNVKGINFKPIFEHEQLLAVEINYANVSILTLKNGINVSQLQKLRFLIEKEYDVVIASNTRANLLNYEISAKMFVTKTNNPSKFNVVYVVKDLTNFTIVF